MADLPSVLCWKWPTFPVFQIIVLVQPAMWSITGLGRENWPSWFYRMHSNSSNIRYDGGALISHLSWWRRLVDVCSSTLAVKMARKMMAKKKTHQVTIVPLNCSRVATQPTSSPPSSGIRYSDSSRRTAWIYCQKTTCTRYWMWLSTVSIQRRDCYYWRELHGDTRIRSRHAS